MDRSITLSHFVEVEALSKSLLWAIEGFIAFYVTYNSCRGVSTHWIEVRPPAMQQKKHCEHGMGKAAKQGVQATPFFKTEWRLHPQGRRVFRTGCQVAPSSLE